MEHLIQKLHQRISQLEQLQSEIKAVWGIMTPQHMVEHVGGIIYGTAHGKGQSSILPAEEAAKWKRRFFSGYYPFPRNIRMAGTQDQPVELSALRYESLDEAKEKLKGAADFFIEQATSHPMQAVGHGYFGDMTMEEWLAFHVKHLEHHLIQFGIRDYDEKIPLIEKMLYKLQRDLSADTPALFGKMNAQQMIEHLGMVFLLSTGKFDIPYKGSEEDAQKYRAQFSNSEAPWKDVFPSESFGVPRPPRHDDIAGSKAELAKTFQRYLEYCEAHPDKDQPHFYLGNLSVDQWREVHVKHLRHHMQQFGFDI